MKCARYILRFFMVGQTYHFARSLCSFHSIWSHHSKDLQQGTNVTAHLLLKILLSRQQIVYSRKGKALRPPKKDLNSAWLSFFIFSVSSLPGAWVVLPYAKKGSCRPLVRSSVQFSCSVGRTLCHPMDWSTSGLLEFTQTHVRWVYDAIQPSHFLLSSSPPAFNLSQHQGLFKWVSSSHQVVKVLEFQLQHQSFQWIFRTDLL